MSLATGAMSITGGMVTTMGGKFVGNEATDAAGAVHVSGAVINIEGSLDSSPSNADFILNARRPLQGGEYADALYVSSSVQNLYIRDTFFSPPAATSVSVNLEDDAWNCDARPCQRGYGYLFG